MLQELAATHPYVHVARGSTKGYGRNVPATMVWNRCGATNGVAKPYMGTPLPYWPESQRNKGGDDLTRLEDWEGGKPTSAHNDRLGSDEIGIHVRFAIFKQHRYDLAKVVS